jgi:toxin YoeB
VKPLQFMGGAWDEYQTLLDNDKKAKRKINQLLQSIDRDGEGAGIGQPEPLRGDRTGYWSRHIDEKNRLIYRVNADGLIQIDEVGTHYGDK